MGFEVNEYWPAPAIHLRVKFRRGGGYLHSYVVLELDERANFREHVHIDVWHGELGCEVFGLFQVDHIVKLLAKYWSD